MARNYKRDRLGRFARTASRSRRRTGAALGAALLIGGPAYMPIGAGIGYAAGRALDRRAARRR